MGRYIIEGGKKLCGEVSINGSKNAVLPILSAALINSCESVIENCPDITDVDLTCQILRQLGCDVERNGKTITVNSKNAENKRINKDLADKMRSSVLFMGVMLGRFGSVIISKPGGCAIGERPLDFHLDALKKMGAQVIEHEKTIECKTTGLKGANIYLPMASVGATENIMLAAAFAQGQTVIYNVAKEPEIFALQEFMKGMGVKVFGAGSNEITVAGGGKFTPIKYKIIPDRIEAGTFLAVVAATKGDIFLKDVNWMDLGKTTEILANCGCLIKEDSGGLYLKAPKKIKSVPLIRTGGYPQFPTDMQPAIMSLLTTSEGTSIIIEQMFENRFTHAQELKKMGAKISAQTRVAIIDGVTHLQGATVEASDLRAGAALIIAGLCAKGETVVNNSKFVLRGYEGFEDKLKNLGASIKLVSDDCGE